MKNHIPSFILFLSVVIASFVAEGCNEDNEAQAPVSAANAAVSAKLPKKPCLLASDYGMTPGIIYRFSHTDEQLWKLTDAQWKTEEIYLQIQTDSATLKSFRITKRDWLNLWVGESLR